MRPDPKSLAETEPDYGVWSIQGLPVRVEYFLPVLEEISAIAVDGLYRFRHGGVEIGGVLFGTAQRGVVRIMAFRALDCEHAFGPRFVLSERDREAMRQLLELPRTEPSLAGLLPVGWYHSHTRSGIALSPRDIEIYNRFFPEHWQVALCLRPEAFGPARAGFFVRERNGDIRAEASYEEFSVRPRRRAGTRPQPQEVPAEPAPERFLQPESPPDAAADELAAAPPPDLPAPTFGGLAPHDEKRAPAPPSAPDTAESEAADFSFPSFATAEPRRERSRKWIWILLALAFTLAAGAGLEAWYRHFARPQPLSLWVADVGGQLLIEWDRTAGPIRNARGATLDITDGKEHLEIQMDSDRLREGSVDYVRRAEIVDVRLIVRESRGRETKESIRFIGQPVKRGETELIRERDELKAEVEKLRLELQTKDAQLRKARAAASR
jgi:proteasome lid subunit RPN8/RPN11